MRPLSPKILRELLRMFEAEDAPLPRDQYIIHALQQALEPKRAVLAARKVRETKRATKKEAWSIVRSVVMARAGGQCEACGAGGPLDADHMFGGSGRRRELESESTVWALCSLQCHRQKTLNQPNAATWLVRFIAHCAQRMVEAQHEGRVWAVRGYQNAALVARARLESLQMQGRAKP